MEHPRLLSFLAFMAWSSYCCPREAFVEMLGKMRNQSVKGQMYMEALVAQQEPPGSSRKKGLRPSVVFHAHLQSRCVPFLSKAARPLLAIIIDCYVYPNNPCQSMNIMKQHGQHVTPVKFTGPWASLYI